MRSPHFGRIVAASLFVIAALYLLPKHRTDDHPASPGNSVQKLAGLNQIAGQGNLLGTPIATTAIDSETQNVTASYELTEDQTRSLALAAIDEIAAHPDDPQRPANVPGVPDSVLDQFDHSEIQTLLEIGGPHAMAVKEDQPRYLFELGRAALAIGRQEQALELLMESSRNGSAAALAYCAVNADLSTDRATRFLSDAYDRGFAPAADWERNFGKNLPANHKPASDDQLSGFKRPDILKAIHDRDTDGLDAQTLEVWAYLSSLIGELSNPQLLYLIDREQVRQLRQLQDPGLSERIEAKLLSDQSYIQDATKVGFASILNGFQAIAETRKNGGSINDEVSAYTQQITQHTVPIEVAKQQGAHDAMTIGLDLNAHGKLAEEVMRGVHWYFEDGVRLHRSRIERLAAEKRSTNPSMGDAFIEWSNRRSLR
jgi:hypothetical protein